MTDRTCSVEGCEARHYARGWCKKHYARWDRRGVIDVSVIRDDLAARWWSKVEKTSEIGCWLWRGTPNTNRSTEDLTYGQFPICHQTCPAHRFGYEMLVGPIPDGLHIDHLCRNPPCVNPAHLEPVTPAENTRRGVHLESRRRNLMARIQCPRGHDLDDVNRVGLGGCRQCQRDSHNAAARRRQAVTELCGYVSAYGRICQRQQGHEGRHHGQIIDYGETA